MELIRGIHNIKLAHFGCALTIGKFDGVHKGHKAVLSQLVAKARALGLPSAVMVFEPQPEEVFAAHRAPARLSRLRDKYEALKSLGIDRLICVNFSTDFASQSPRDFVQGLLLNKLGVKFLVVGDDFKFGYQRQGDFTYLNTVAKDSGFEVVSTQSFRIDNHRISSTALREALHQGDFKKATAMIGRPYAISGKVVHGEKNGRTIGFPTANLLLKRHKSPLHGVFAVRVKVCEQYYGGVANLGFRPTLNGQCLQLETHLFDFAGDLYGTRLKVEFIEKIRDEAKFQNFASLKQQIELDAKHAKQYWADYIQNGNRE